MMGPDQNQPISFAKIVKLYHLQLIIVQRKKIGISQNQCEQDRPLRKSQLTKKITFNLFASNLQALKDTIPPSI